MNIGSENMDVQYELSQWRIKLTTISRNLMDLAETQSTKIIKVRLNDPIHGYSGITKEKASHALKSLENLWKSYLLLAGVVEEATDLAGKNGIFRNTESEVRQLLQGESVVLEAEHIPIITRELLANAEQCDRVTPAGMLSAMQQQFAQVRDTLTDIAQAQSKLIAKVTALEEEALMLTNWSKALGVEGESLIDVSATRLRIEADPLSCLQDAERLEVEMAKQRIILKNIQQERKEIDVSLEAARGMLRELETLVVRSNQAIAETQEQILRPARLVTPMNPEITQFLQGWLNTLEETAKAGRYKAVKIGLAKWERECKMHLAAEEENYQRNQFALEERADLKGRFKALSVKAQVFKSKGLVLGSSLEGLANQVQEVLTIYPFDIDAARTLVGTFEATLMAMIKASNENK